MQKTESLRICAAVVTCIYASSSHANGEQFYFGLFGTSDESYVNSLSALGTSAVGRYKIPGTPQNTGTLEGYEAYLWTNSGSKKLGFLRGGEFSEANAISADGTTVVGSSDSATGTQAFRWTASGGMHGLGYLSSEFQYSRATDVSADGSIVVGYSNPNNNGSAGNEAFIWSAKTGMVGLGSLENSNNSSLAYAVSEDGTTVVGDSGQQAFKWTKSSGMKGLGFLPTYGQSFANDVSADGSVIVGEAVRSGSTSQAFRWTESSGMQGLGFLQNSNSSRALAISGNGKVIVGESIITNGSETAFRWTESGGMESVKTWLTKNGVNYSGILSTAKSTNHDGSVIVGDGYTSNGRQPWLARVGGLGIGSGILTDVPAFNATLLETATQAPQLSASLANLTLNGSHHRSILDTGLARSTNGLCSWATADAYNQHTSKTRMELVEVGICKDIGKSRFAIGAGMTQGKQDWSMGGSATLTGQYLLAEAATILAGNVQPSVLLYYGTHATELNRNYLNGTTLVSSIANPDTNSFSARGRLDWKDVAEFAKFRLSPYASVTWSESRMDGYTETGGGFPASYSGVRWHSNDVRAGLAAKRSIAANTDLRLSAEAAHRNDEGGNSKVQVIGLFGFNTGEQSVSQNIYRAIVDIDHRFSDRSLATVSLISSTSEGNTNWGISAGYRAAF